MSSFQTPTISIIIPALNEAHSIGATLDAVSRLSVRAEVIVVDGGSDDDTRKVASAHGAQVIESARGRGAQMHRGACAAQGEVLWLLHADTIVPVNALERIIAALDEPRVVAGNFEVRFDGLGWAARFMTWLYPRLRRLGLYYGDSAIFVRRVAYERVGGFKPLPIFEDLDLLRGLRKHGRIIHVPAVVVTSSRRFEGRSFVATFTRWGSLQVLYWLGVGPPTLGRLYAPIRQSGKLHELATSGPENRSQRPARN